MGNFVSKFFLTNESRKENNEPQQAATQDSNMCTPIEKKKILVDPRSVSTGITRTPIEIQYTPVGVTKGTITAIPKYLQKKQYLETDMDVVIPPLTPRKQIPKIMASDQLLESDELQDYLTSRTNVLKDKKVITPIDKERYAVLGLDPRSPAADFDRTPILMPKSLALMRARSHESLSRRGSYETDIYNMRNSCQDINISSDVPEIKLLSDIASEDVKTNMEESNKLYTPNASQSDSDLSMSKSEEEEITVIKNPKYKSGKEKSLMSDEQTVATDKKEDKNSTDKLDNCKNLEYNIKTLHIKDDEEIEIWHDSLSSKENVSGKKDKKIVSEKAPREDIIITFDEHAIINISLSKSVKTEENCQKKGDKEIKKNIETDSKLILNEKKIFTPENKHGTEMRNNRTPLGNRSNNGQMQRRPPKSPQLSRNKTVSTRMQQENTPPYKTYSAKTKNGIQWDPNSTVFI